MNNAKLEEIITILKSIVLQNQSQNIYESKMLNGLKYGYQDPINYAARKLYVVFVQNVHYLHRTV